MFLPLLLILNLFLIVYSFKEMSALEWRIFEGQELRYNVHKYLVKLQFHGHNEGPVGICSGSIISSSWIITSAHCILPNFHKVVVLHRIKDNVRALVEVDKCDMYPHPDFIQNLSTEKNREKDVALLYIRHPIKFDSSIGLVELTKRDPRIGDIGIMAGYGQSESRSSFPKEGAAVIMRCPYYSGNVFCTRGAVRAGAGDSGGPLIYKGRLVGVTSAGCEDVHVNRMCLTMFASVAANMNWIREITKQVVNKEKSNGFW